MNIKLKIQSLSLISLVISGMFLFSSCKDDKSDSTSDTSKPVITVAEPIANATITDELHMEYTVTDNIELASTKILVLGPSQTELYTNTKTLNGLKVFAFHEHFVPTVTSHTDAEVIITAKDKAGNESSITIPVSIHPK